MGISEEETIEQLTKIVEGIIAEERKARQSLLHNDKEGLEDVLWNPMAFYNMHAVLMVKKH